MAIPARRAVRCRRLRPHRKGCLCSFQYAVARRTASSISGQASKRRPFNASERRIFHHGSIRFRYAAYLGWNTNSQRGWASANKRTSMALWTLRLSTTCVDPLDAGVDPALDRSEEIDPVRGGAARVGFGEGLPRGRPEGTKDIALAAPAVVDLLLGPLRFRRGRLDRAPAGVAAGRVRPHLVEADDYAALGRGGVEAAGRPLLRSNSGSTRAPNQVSS